MGKHLPVQYEALSEVPGARRLLAHHGRALEVGRGRLLEMAVAVGGLLALVE